MNARDISAKAARDALLAISENARAAISDATEKAHAEIDALATTATRAPVAAISMGAINLFPGAGTGGRFREVFGRRIPEELPNGEYDAVLVFFPREPR